MAASTSLSRQLAALSGETRRRGKASLLFAARDAEAHDLPTVYSIGVNGLAELQRAEARFSAFEADVFSEAWVTLDREAHLSEAEAAEKLNPRITAFLRLLSPHFAHKAAHKALEYLIRRFKIHVYNVDALMECALPYHESVMFGRLVQIIELSAASKTLGSGSVTVPLWQFLADNQRSGATLPRNVLVQQCLKDSAVLHFICDRAHALAGAAAAGECIASPFMTFYSVTLVELLSRALAVPESMVLLLLPFVMKGLKARGDAYREYRAGTYIVATRLATRVAFQERVFDALVQQVMTNMGDEEEEQSEAVRCVAAVFQSQVAAQGLPAAVDIEDTDTRWLVRYELPSKCVKCAAKAAGFVTALVALCASSDCNHFVRCVLLSAVVGIARKPKHSAFAANLITALPASTLNACGTALTRRILHLKRTGGGVTSPVVMSTPVVEGVDVAGPSDVALDAATAASDAYSTLLRLLSNRAPNAVDEGLRVALHHRPRGASLSGADTTLPLAHVLSRSPTVSPLFGAQNGAIDGMNDRALVEWVATALAGTSHVPTEDGDETDTSGQVSLSLALNHASAAVRLRAMHVLDNMSATLLQAGAAGSSGSATTIDLAKALSTISQGLDQGMFDDDASVVRAALNVHRRLLLQGVIAVTLPSSSVSGTEAPKARHHERVARLVARATSMLHKWIPSACATVEAVSATGAGASFIRSRHCVSARHVVASTLALLAIPLAHARNVLIPASSSHHDTDNTMCIVACALLQHLPIGTEAVRIPAGVLPTTPDDDVAAAVMDAPAAESLDLHAVALLLAARCATPLFSRLREHATLSSQAAAVDEDAPHRNCTHLLASSLLHSTASDSAHDSCWAPIKCVLDVHDRDEAYTARGYWVAFAALDTALHSLATSSTSSARVAIQAALPMAMHSLRLLWVSTQAALVSASRARLEKRSKRALHDAAAADKITATPALGLTCKGGSAHVYSDLDAEVASHGSWVLIDDEQVLEYRINTALRQRARASLLLGALTRVIRAVRACGETAQHVCLWTDVSHALTSWPHARRESSMEASPELHASQYTPADAADVLARLLLLLWNTGPDAISPPCLLQPLREVCNCIGVPSPSDTAAFVHVFASVLACRAMSSLAVRHCLQILHVRLASSDVSAAAHAQDVQACVPAFFSIVATRDADASSRAACWSVMRALAASPSSAPPASAAAAALTLLRATVAAAPPVVATDADQSVLAAYHGARACVNGVTSPALLALCATEADVRPAAAAVLSMLVSDALSNVFASRLLSTAVPARVLLSMLDTCRTLVASCMRHGRADAETGSAAAILHMPVSLHSVARACADIVRTALHASSGSEYAAVAAPDRVAIVSACMAFIREEVQRGVVELTLHEDISSSVASSQPAAAWLTCVLDAVDAPVWSTACETTVKVPGARGADKERAVADALFESLVERIRVGPAAAASACRHVLSRVMLPAPLLLRFMHRLAVVARDASSSAPPPTHKPQFSNARVVRATLQPLDGHLSAFTEWVTRSTIFAETLTSALHASPASVPGIETLMHPLFVLVESLSAAPSCMTMLVDSRTSAVAGTPQRAPTASAAHAPDVNTWEEDDTTSSIEYAKQMLLSLLHQVSNRALDAEAGAPGSAAPVVAALQAHADVDLVLHCIHGDVSTQTRSAALLLLGSLASLLPQQVLGRLMPALAAVGSVAVSREDGYSLSVVQRLVETVVPALRRHGARVGVTLHSLLDVFSRYFFDIPVHRRKNVFGALLRHIVDGGDAEFSATPEGEPSRYAASLAAFLLRQYTLHGDKSTPAASTGAKSSVPDVCMSILHRFTPTQQLRALSQLLHVASRLFAPVGEDAMALDAAADDDVSVSDVEEIEGAAAARVEREDVDALLSPLLHTSVESGATELSSGQRFDLGLNVISFTVAHLSSKQFVDAALAAPAGASSDPDSSALFTQQYYLLFAERLFDLLAVASNRLRAATNDHAAATQRAEALHVRAVEVAAAAARAPRATDGGATVTAARQAAQAAQRQQGGFAVVLTFWQRANKELFSALSHLSVLLDPAAFVTVVTGLLQHEDSTVQRHSLAFFTEYLRSNYGDGTSAIKEDETVQYLTLVEDLVTVLQTNVSPVSGEDQQDIHARDINRQIALDTLATLARYFARGHPGAFEPALAAAVDILRQPTGQRTSLPVVASAMLCFAALATHMGPRIVPLLPSSLAAILSSLELSMPTTAPAAADGGDGDENPVAHVYALRLAALAALRIVIVQLPTFMHSYLPRVFTVILHPRIAGADVLPVGAWRAGRTPEVDDILASLSQPLRSADAASLDITGVPASAVLDTAPSSESMLAQVQMEAIRAAAVEVLAHVATHIPMRTLIPALLSSIEGMKRMSFTAVRQGMVVLHAAIHRATKVELREHTTSLFRFFLAAFDLRWMRVDSDTAGHLQVAHDAGGSNGGAALLPSSAVAALNGIAVYGATAEAATVDAFIAMAMKMSETQLRPVLLKLLQWANADASELIADVEIAAAEGVTLPRAWVAGSANPLPPALMQFALLSRRIVLHRVLASLALVLRSLFMPLFSYVLPDAARELTELTAATIAAHASSTAAASASKPGKRVRAEEAAAPSSRKKAAGDEHASAADAASSGRLQFGELFFLDSCLWNPVEMHDEAAGVWAWALPTTVHALRSVCLQTLRCSFAADTAQEPDGFMSKAPRERLDTVLSPLMEQFKLPLVAPRTAGANVGIPGAADGYRSFVRVYLLPCVGDLLLALRKDTLWKPLHSALTLLAVHNLARVRLAALQALRVVHERGGDDALLLMPEAFPCLSECVRDDDTHVQAEANKLVRMLEEKSGEDLQVYLA